MNHYLDAYKDGHKWVTFCRTCGKEENEIFENGSLLSGPCSGPKYDVKNTVDKSSIDDYVSRMIADNGNSNME